MESGDTLERIEKKLDHVIEFLKIEVKPNCEKMSDHIDLITDVYSKVRRPLFFICDQVKRIALFKQLSHSQEYAPIEQNVTST